MSEDKFKCLAEIDAMVEHMRSSPAEEITNLDATPLGAKVVDDPTP